MSIEEIKTQFAPMKCSNQLEFDTAINAINNQQSLENHPFDDRIRELNRQNALVKTQMQALRVQLEAIKVERIDIEQKKKDVNRVFHQLKLQLMKLNPKGLKNEPDL